MTRTTSLIAIGLAAAALGACSDAGKPAGPIGITSASRIFEAKECKPPVPDALITLPIAPRNQRVDLYTPVFSNPTSVTNPLFPISNLSQVVLVGVVDGFPFRAETTLLPATKRINLGGRIVETLISQYVAYLDRRIDETALDWYAQDDKGAVWYLGEDVANYDEGVIVDTDGTWLACKDGPAALIMPALPKVGDVWRVEDIYPTVFEEIEVTHVNQTVAGPLGPVTGAFTVQQLGLDASLTPKTFAPGYGEFSTGSGNDVEALALAIPTDASPLPAPAELRALLGGSRRVFRAAGAGDWTNASRTVGEMNAAWVRYQTRVIPRLLKPLMAEALDELTQAVAARDRAESRQFALDVSKNGLDLLLQHRSRIDVDFARLELWVRQLIIDAEAEDAGGVASDLAILNTILFRLTDTGDQRVRNDVRSLRRQLSAIRAAAERRSSAGVLKGVSEMQAILRKHVGGTED